MTTIPEAEPAAQLEAALAAAGVGVQKWGDGEFWKVVGVDHPHQIGKLPIDDALKPVLYKYLTPRSLQSIWRAPTPPTFSMAEYVAFLEEFWATAQETDIEALNARLAHLTMLVRYGSKKAIAEERDAIVAAQRQRPDEKLNPDGSPVVVAGGILMGTSTGGIFQRGER
jgi:hypothetical protein